MHVVNLRRAYAAVVSLVTVVMLLIGGWRLAWDVAALTVVDAAPRGLHGSTVPGVQERWEWHVQMRRRTAARRLVGDLLAVMAVGWVHVRHRRDME